MKLFMGVLFATFALNDGFLSLPGYRVGDVKNDYDYDYNYTNVEGAIDNGYYYKNNNSSVLNVDAGHDLLRRISERLFPSGFFGRAGSDEDDYVEISIPAIDPKKANSTSTVKVVDGHKVKVNETVYGDENGVFMVRVVNIRPLEEGETVEETENKDIKPVTQGPQENTLENESTESDERREPLEKKPAENEIRATLTIRR